MWKPSLLATLCVASLSACAHPHIHKRKVQSADHASVVHAGRIVYASSASAGDVAAAFGGLEARLTSVSALPQDVVKLTIYLVDLTEQREAAVEQALGLMFGERLPDVTLLGVAALADGKAVHLDAVAVID